MSSSSCFWACFKFCSVRSFGRGLRAPRGVRKPELDPAGFGLRQVRFVQAAVNFVGPRVRALGISALRVGFELRVISLLRNAVEDEKRSAPMEMMVSYVDDRKLDFILVRQPGTRVLWFVFENLKTEISKSQTAKKRGRPFVPGLMRLKPRCDDA